MVGYIDNALCSIKRSTNKKVRLNTTHWFMSKPFSLMGCPFSSRCQLILLQKTLRLGMLRCSAMGSATSLLWVAHVGELHTHKLAMGSATSILLQQTVYPLGQTASY